MRYAVAAAVLASLSCVGAHAQDSKNYPTKPVRFIVPFAPGGGVDIVGSTRQEFAAFIKIELEKAGRIIRQANIRAD